MLPNNALKRPVTGLAVGLITRGKLAVLLLLVGTVGSCLDHAEPETYLIPRYYVGEVYVIFNVSDGAAPEVEGGRRVYRIPPSGILRTQFPPTYGLVDWSFAYVGPSRAELTPIPKGPSGTIHDTPVNRANTTIEIHQYETGVTGGPVPGKPGSFSSDAPCAVRYSRFFIGTRAQYLEHPRRIDIGEYLERNPIPCKHTAADRVR